MKVLRMFGAAMMAVVLSSGMVSCGDDDEVIVLDPEIKKTIVDEVLTLSKDVALEDAKFITTPKEVSIPKGPLKKIVFCEEEAILYVADATRAIVDGKNVFVCEYTMDGTNLIIENDELGTITVSMTGIMEVMIDKDSYPCEVVTLPAAATPTAVGLCRTWKNPTYQAAIFFDQLPIYGVNEHKTYTEVKPLIEDVLDKILAQDSNLRDRSFQLLSSDIESVNFMTNGKVYLKFADGKVEESDWEWISEADGKIKTVVDGKDVVIDVRFEAGEPNKAHFVIDANCAGIDGLGVHSLSGRIIANTID